MRLVAPALAVLLAAPLSTFAQDPAPPKPAPPATKPAAPAAAAAPAGKGLAQVRGVLLDATGTPAVKHQFALRGENGDLFTSGPTGVDGAFVVPGVPAGTYRLAAFGPDGSEFAIAGGPVTVAAGQVQRLEARIAGNATAPGRAVPAEAGKKGAFSRFAGSTGGKVALALAGAAAVGLVIAGSGDDDAEPVSPSQP